MNTDKKYILKPGSHQFAPGSAAIHNNDNITDAEAAWYLEKYPHIASLFIAMPDDEIAAQGKANEIKPKKKLKPIATFLKGDKEETI